MTISIDFSAPDLDQRLSWLNPPAAATPTSAGLRVVPHVGDWWSRTADSSSDDVEKKRVDEAAAAPGRARRRRPPRRGL